MMIFIKTKDTHITKSIKGFTLVELLIAIFILALMMATVLGIFTGVVSSAREAEKRSELYQTGRAVLDIVTTDIRCMVKKEPADTNNPLSDVLEKPNQLKNFITTNSLTMGREPSLLLSEVAYSVQKNDGDNLYSLWRRAESPPTEPFDEGGGAVPICRIIESFRLEIIHFNDRKEDLVESFFHEAIMVDLTLNLEGYRERFVTMVRPIAEISE